MRLNEIENFKPTCAACYMESSATLVYAPISIGELVDKITILEIKAERITDSRSLNIAKELGALRSLLREHNFDIDCQMINELREVNLRLWHVEDNIREMDKSGRFDNAFVSLARSVYKLNDERAAIKKKINSEYGSDIVEEKSYSSFQ